jgi:radical SAM protein with 4Fe4S-binding SPASM domain
MSPVELEIGAKRCNAGEYSMCVEPNGDVLPCQSFYVAAGNLLRDPWPHIWNSDLFRSFRERTSTPQAAGLPAQCWECPDLALCGGGCRIERETRQGRATVEHAASCTGCRSTGSTAPAAQELPTAGFIPVEGMRKVATRSGGKDADAAQ